MQDGQPFGIAVLDVHEGKWAIWQVSVDSFYGRLRASTTNAVVRDHFERTEFEALVGNRQLLVTPRAAVACPEADIAGPELFNGQRFADLCGSWIDLLDGMFRAENKRREAENERRKEAKRAGTGGTYTKLSPLLDLGLPGLPAEALWTSDAACVEEARVEALRVANGCVRLLDYWLDIEAARTRKNRTYFNGVGGPEIRLWPCEAPTLATV